ncbi:LAMI_0A03928g1_1 [Lachancea mirantina]|uniref:LAMI_0A03928g1_1 n=1 Tax=Lachancea mirantina TaxID=1230905 RepID=A0A1G4IP58_9SACH|nr:LAMI_0A03928g1_1 [Lachancea mirantina]
MTKDIPNYCNNEDPGVVRIFIIRHGQTAENAAKILQGHLDTDLNDVGRDQADKLGKYLAEDRQIKFDRVYTSDLKRCQQTLKQILTHYAENPEIIVQPGLRERAMGVIQGMHIRAAEQYAADHGKTSFREFGEKPDAFQERLTGNVLTLVKESEQDGLENIAMISHGGSIRQLLKWLNYTEHDIHKIIVYNTSVTIIDYIKDTATFEVKRVGNTQHLGQGEFIVSDMRLR